MDTCQEMGWELVDALGDASPLDLGFHGFPWNDYFTPKSHAADGKWYIFRKSYDPDAPEAEYILETDPNARQDMHWMIEKKYNWLFLYCYPVWVVFFILCGNMFWEASKIRTVVYGVAIALWASANGCFYLSKKGFLTLPTGWLTRPVKNAMRVISTLLCGALNLAACVLLALGILHLTSTLSSIPGIIYDPITYLEENDYVNSNMEIDVYTTGTITFVLTDNVDSYTFTRPKNTSKTWSFRYLSSLEWEQQYYITCGGPYADHMVIVSDDGSVYEPVYEAQFEAGYVPIFSFDISQEQEYRGILVCRDEAGVYHYDCTAVTYVGLADWDNVPEAQYRRTICTGFSVLDDAVTPRQSAFITAYSNWKSSVYETSPARLTVTEDNFFLEVTYAYPPILTIEHSYSVAGKSMGYDSYASPTTIVQDIYDYQDGQAIFRWKQYFDTGLWALIRADDLTMEQIQTALTAIVGVSAASPPGSAYEQTVTYAVTVPDSLITLWQEAIAE